jgi:hypothetical protein
MNRILVNTTLSLLCIIAGPAIASADGAADKSEPKAHQEQIIVMTDAGDPDAKAAHMVHCGDDKSKVETNHSSHNGKTEERVKIVMCGKDGANSADIATKLKDARDKIAANDKIDAATRARVLARLDAHIARLKDADAKPAQ